MVHRFVEQHFKFLLNIQNFKMYNTLYSQLNSNAKYILMLFNKA